MQYDLDRGRTHRRIARSSSKGGGCSGLGAVENKVSISRMKFKTLTDS